MAQSLDTRGYISHRSPSFLLILIGILAIVLPFVAGISIAILAGVALLVAGFAYVALAFASSGTGLVLWRTLLGVLFIGTGLDLILHPAVGLVSLTLLVAVVFFFEAVSEIAAFFRLRNYPGSGWLLANGLITLLLAGMIWANWPSSAAWAIGTLVGLNLIMSGVTPMRFYRVSQAL